ncbi:MAG: hypothetical protein WCK06_08880 [Actinomycetota bacterium]
MQQTNSIAKSLKRPLGLLILLVLVAVTGCAGDKYNNDNRPPAPITLSAAISDSQIILNPSEIGAGPIVLIITNQSHASQVITLESQSSTSAPGTTQSTAAVKPTNTGQIQVNAQTGRYTLHVADQAIAPATLVVGAQRKSSQNELLLP